MTSLFIQTLRQAPADARSPGSQLLLRGGFIRVPESGSPAFLPLGVLLRRRAERCVMDALHPFDPQPIALPSVPAAELLAALMTVVSGVVQSYKQLPCLLSETRLVGDDRNRGAGGLLGAGRGLVLDLYGLHPDVADRDTRHEQVRAALAGLLSSLCPGLLAAVDVGRLPGSEDLAAVQWVLPHPDGGAAIVTCPACGYAAAQSAASLSRVLPLAEAPAARRDVETPNCRTIAELAGFLGIPEARTAKAVFLMASYADQADRFVLTVVRGDTALDEAKLLAAIGASAIVPASAEQIRRAGAEPGYGSPVGLAGVTVVVDERAAASPNLVAGANRTGHHTLNVNYGRDYQGLVADIAMAQQGSPCPTCGAALVLQHAIEIARAEPAAGPPGGAPAASYLDREGRSQPVLAACYRVWLDRLIGAVAEQRWDEHGIVWPTALAPYDVHLMTLGHAAAVTEAAEELYAALTGAGYGVLFDDRQERAGIKFNDADLLGAPVRIAVGERGLQAGVVEVKRRDRPEVLQVPAAGAAACLAEVLAGLR